MMYPYMTLSDDTEIVHSEFLEDGMVRVYVEKPDDEDCFHHMTCYLPDFRIEEVYKFSDEEVASYMKLIKSNAYNIMDFSKHGGFEIVAELE